MCPARRGGPGRRQEDRVGGDAVAAHRGEHGVGADFEVDGDAPRFEGADAVEEADSPAGMAYPVARVEEFAGGDRAAGEIGDDREGRRVVGQALGDLAEVVQHALHVRGVEGVADPQPFGLAAARPPVAGDREDGVLVACQHGRGGSVDRGDLHATGEVGEPRGEFGLRRLDGDHRAALREGLHQTAACRDESRRVRQ